MKSSVRIWVFRLFVAAAALAIALLGAEVLGSFVLRHVLQKSLEPKFQFDSYRIFAQRPGFREGDGKRDWIVINEQGFRRSLDVPRTKQANTVRVFLMGGSAAAGTSSAPPYPVRQVHMDETIDYYLEHQLQKKFPDHRIEVINAAVTGYVTYQHTAYILTSLLDFEPDVFLFFDGINDHYTVNDSPEYYYAGNPYQFWKSRLQRPSVWNLADYTAHWLSFHSGGVRGYMAWRMNRDAASQFVRREAGFVEPATSEAMIEAHRRAAPKQFLRSIQANLAIMRSFDIDALVCTQPILALRNEELLSAAEKSFLAYETKKVRYRTLHPVVVEEVKSIASKFATPFLDLNPTFNDPEHRGDQLFTDYAHLTARGGELSAQAIAPQLERIVHARLERENRRRLSAAAR
jgi:lysophospholipase L1-like esterase